MPLAEAQPVDAGDDEQPGLVLRQQERRDGRRLTGRADHHRAQASDAVRHRAPELTRDERAAQQHRDHCGALPWAYSDVRTERHQMGIRNRHWNATAEPRHADHALHQIGPQPEDWTGPAPR